LKTIQGPRGRIYPDHNPETVALLGMGPSVQDFMTETMTQEMKPEHHDEVWAINMVANCFRADVCFWMDDLESQSKACPHPLLPTTKLKEAFAEQRIAGLYPAGGPRFENLIKMIRESEDWVPHERYDWIVEEFKTLINSNLGGLSFVSVTQITNMFNEDRNKAIPDPKRSLAGLIQKLASLNIPVVTPKRHTDLVPTSFDYPIDEVSALGFSMFGKPYLQNGVAMAIGYAIWKGVKRLKIYGCDFTYPNRNFAEEGRGCVEAWIALAASKNVQVYLSPHTSLLDTVKGYGVYGYAEQPEIILPDGGKFKYVQQTAAPNGVYVPENSQGVRNELPGAAQADSTGGIRNREFGHAAVNAGRVGNQQSGAGHAQA